MEEYIHEEISKKKQTMKYFYMYEIQFLSHSIKDGSEFIMKVYDYIEANNKSKANAIFKKNVKSSEYYARIGPSIIDIYVVTIDESINKATGCENIYHNDHPQPSLFDLTNGD